ncbi:MAG: hypothetical protein HW380_3184 [Magnetococcales bacterium]|nr:hypothetical protein [Magnetococcales bacterium]
MNRTGRLGSRRYAVLTACPFRRHGLGQGKEQGQDAQEQV